MASAVPRSRLRRQPMKIDLITLSDSEEEKEAMDDNIFSVMNGHVGRRTETDRTSKDQSPSARHLSNGRAVEKKSDQTEQQRDSNRSVVFPNGFDGRRYHPFYSDEVYPPIRPDHLVWTAPAPFDDYEDEDEVGQENDAPSPVAGPDRTGLSNGGDGKKRKGSCRRVVIGENDSSDSDEGLMDHIMKLRKVSHSDDEEEDSKMDSSTFLTSAVPTDLLKPCVVELKQLPEEVIREALRNSPMARDGSPGKYDLGSNASTSKATEPSSSSVTWTKQMEPSEKQGTSREDDERRLAELIERRNELSKKMDKEEHKSPIVINLFDRRGREKEPGEHERKEAMGQKANEERRLVKDRDPFGLGEHQRHPSSNRKRVPSLTENEKVGAAQGAHKQPSTSADSRKPAVVSIRNVAELQKRLAPLADAMPSTSRRAPSETIGRLQKSASGSSATSKGRREAPSMGDHAVQKPRSKSVSSDDGGMDRAETKLPTSGTATRRTVQLSADETVQTLCSRSAAAFEDGSHDRSFGIREAIRKGRMQLENRLAQKDQLVSAKTPSSVAHAETSASLKRTARIPKLSPSKQRRTTAEYVSPLDHCLSYNAASSSAAATTTATTTATPPTPTKSPYVKALLKRIHQKSAYGQQSTKSVQPVVPSSAAPTKSILKKSQRSSDESAEEGKLVIDCSPKKTVTFVEQPHIRYFEPAKPRRSLVAPRCVGSEASEAAQGGQNITALTVEDEVISAILKWNPHWLQEAKEMQEEGAFEELPPIAPQWPLLKVQKSYPSLGTYFETYKGLLLYETWGKVFQEYCTGLGETKDRLEGRVVNVVTVGRTFKDFSVVALVDKDKVQDIRENVLLTFRLADRKIHDQQHEPEFFGLITRAQWGTYRRLDEVTPELRKCAKVTEENVKRFCHMKMTIRARWKTNMPTYEIGPMVVQVMSDLSWMIRLMTALTSVQHSPLAQMIVNPSTIARPVCPTDENLRIKNNASIKYNEEQLKAISACVLALANEEKPAIQLIAGPPGTGKSQTIVGLIEEIQLVGTCLGLIEEIQLMRLQQHKNEVGARESRPSKHRGIILVMAPSGEKVDELSRRVLAMNRFYHSSMPGNRFLKFLRLGARATVAEDVARYCMGTLMENNMRQEEVSAPASVGENRSQITERIAHLQGQLYSFLESQLSEEEQALQQRLQAEIKELERSLASNRKGRKHHTTKVTPPEPNTASFLREYLKKAEEHKRRLLEHADVIAATLNEDGQDLDLLKQMHREGIISISCAIVYDACEAPELGTLIAAFPPVKKVFLFGKEKQEKSTNVLSKIAYENGFGNSLFSRIMSNFEPSSAPVFRLNTRRVSQ